MAVQEDGQVIKQAVSRALASKKTRGNFIKTAMGVGAGLGTLPFFAVLSGCETPAEADKREAIANYYAQAINLQMKILIERGIVGDHNLVNLNTFQGYSTEGSIQGRGGGFF